MRAKKVQVMGAGIAGLSIAVALSKHNMEVELFEAAPELRPAGAGIILAANAMKACQKLGVESAVQMAAHPMHQALITSRNGQELTRMDFDALPGNANRSYAIHRADLQQALLEHLPNTHIHLGKRAVSFASTGDVVTTWFQDGSQTESPFVIAADGIHSAFRQQLVKGSVPRYAGYTCWRGIGTLPSSYPSQHQVVESWGTGKRLGIVPLSNGRVYWFAVANAPEGSPQMRDLDKGGLLELFKEFNSTYTEVLEATPEPSIIWGDLCDLDPLERFHFGNILLAGDAAHATTPNMGQGGCQALEDAATLGACSEKTDSLNFAFAQFEKLRLERTATVIKRSRAIGKIGQIGNPVLARLRNAAMKITPNSVGAKQVKWLADVSF